MAYILEKWDDAEKAGQIAKLPPPSGAGIDEPDVLSEVARVELWVSSFNDPGQDWNEFRLFDGKGRVIHTRRFDGY